MSERTRIILGTSTRSPKDPSTPQGPMPPLTPELSKKVFERDKHTCQACGFQSTKYQEVHFKNNNPRDTRPENMETMCIFCQQCFCLDLVAEMRSGVLIWLPEIPQSDLSNIMRAIYVARISQGPVSDAARTILEKLLKRREEASARLGTDNPAVLSSVLNDYLTAKHYARRAEKLDGVRLMPLDRRIIKQADLEFNQFPQILAYWRSKDGPFGNKLPPTWPLLHKELLKVA